MDALFFTVYILRVSRGKNVLLLFTPFDDTFDVRWLSLSLSLFFSHSLSPCAYRAKRRGGSRLSGIYTHAISERQTVDARHSYEVGLFALSFL